MPGKLRTIVLMVTSALLVFTISVTAFGAAVQEQKTDVQTYGAFASSDALPFNSDVVTGRLNNGLEYFILENPYPEGRADLRLFVDAGSVLEREDQQGLAHYVEHMAFNGTKQFGENELVAYLESLGMQFGPEVNAFTSFDETVYMLDVPTTNPTAFREGFRVLQQWATAITFEPEAVERERGVIIEEWRTGRGAAMRMLDDHLPVLLGDSRYAERLPIGKVEQIRTATAEDLREFYERWYRPDNMVVLAVGDFQATDVEDHIQRYFGRIAKPESSLDRLYADVPIPDSRRLNVAHDPEARYSTVSVYGLEEPAPFGTVSDYRHHLVRALFSSVLNERLRDISRAGDAPFLQAQIGWTRFVRSLSLESAGVVVSEKPVRETVEALLLEVERMRRYGALPEELARAKDRLLESIEQTYTNRRTLRSARLIEELTRHVSEGEPVPGIEYEYDLYRALLPEISLQDVNRIATEFLTNDDVTVLASLAEDDALEVSESDLDALLNNLAIAQLERPQRQVLSESLMESPPHPKPAVEIVEHGDVGVTTYRFGNGAEVHVLPTDLKEDEILFQAYSPGGLSQVPDNQVPAARLAPAVVFSSGVADFSIGELEKTLSGTSVSLNGSIGRTSETLSGSTRREDMELLFQLLHLSFAHPRADQAILQNQLRGLTEQIEGARRAPRGRFSLRFQELYANGDPRIAPPDPEEWAEVTVEDIRSVFADRFPGVGDFSFFLVGSVDPDEVADLAERYIATLPSGPFGTGSSEQILPTEYSPPQGATAEILRAGQEPVSQVGILLNGHYNWSQEENHRFNSLIDLLRVRMREEIREATGGTYGVGVYGSRTHEPEERFLVQIAFGCNPDQAHDLSAQVFEILTEIAANGPEQDEVQRIRAQQRESYAKDIQQNGYWMNNMVFSVQHGRDFSAMLQYPDLIDSLDAAAIHEVAQTYLTTTNQTVLTLLPAEQEAAE